MRAYGCLSTEHIEKYQVYDQIGPIPAEYTIKDLGEVINQGNKGCCVSCSIYEMYNFYCLSAGKKLDIKYDYTYNNRKDKSIDGQSVGEAFTFMRDNNHIKVFSRISTIDSLKTSIVTNGPAALAMIVRDASRDDFWHGDDTQPIGHCVAAVGYDRDSIIIKNSWGYEYGNNGLYNIPVKEFNKIVKEVWTIIV